MIWQDLIITLVNVIFAYALIPQVYQGFKEKKGFIHIQTGFLNSLGMFLVAFAFFTLGLTFSWIIGAFNATLWMVLFIQKIIY
ncbi:hypothetical protein KAT80_01175 [Candidatus Pacearchaeota archaeon]|nr:hypothetical protein [Candidatus Pacearchaeota archaeon]